MSSSHSFSQRLTLQCRNVHTNNGTVILDAYQKGRTTVMLQSHFNRRWELNDDTGTTRDRSSSDRPRGPPQPNIDKSDWCTFWIGFRTATSTASRIPEVRLMTSQAFINGVRKTVLRARRRMQHNVLAVHHLAERLQWWQEHIQLIPTQWRTVLISGESRFILFRGDGRLSTS